MNAFDLKGKISTVAEADNSTVVAEYIPSPRKSENYQSEADLEKEFIELLHTQGYDYIKIKSGADLINNLRVQLEKLNNYKFSDNEWHNFFNAVISNPNNRIEEKTEILQATDTAQVLLRDNGEEKNIRLLDKQTIHNNYLQVINQYEVDGNYHNRYDVTVLVNGLPLIHIELKRRGIILREAFNQIDRYQRDSFWADTGLYEYVQLFVISNGTQTKYYSNTVREGHIKTLTKKKSNTFEFTSYWADSKNKPILDLTDFTKTFFAKHTVLNILTKYCIFTTEKRLLVMRPYQIVACEKILNKIKIAQNYKKFGTTEGGGFIWHTTGSGKTLTSFKTAMLATNIPNINKVLFVVDRKDLDYQTMKEYDRFQKGSANSNTSTAVLTRQLNDSSSKIIITTIQKLDNFIKKNLANEVYNKEIVVIFDECHRSQFGDMHKRIVGKFKKYYIFGFTGTPIFPANCVGNSLKTTEQTFGDKLHTYTIVDAINDKNVLPFKVNFYKTLAPKENIKDKKVYAIDSKEAVMKPSRIEGIVKYVLEHFGQYTKNDEDYAFKQLTNVSQIANDKNKKIEEVRVGTRLKGFNSLFACADIEMAKAYYSEFKKQDHNLKIALIYSYGANEELDDGLYEENNESTESLDIDSRTFLNNAIKDYNQMYGTTYDTSSEKFQNYYKDLSLRMKNKEIDILIVANMFLTGFDATTLNTLWVDKNLKYHGLIQAFSRTNRILNSVKTFGNIVCFRNLEQQLKDALALFGNSDAKGIILLKTYNEYYNGYQDGKHIFEGYKALVQQIKALYPIGEQIIGEQNKKEFIKLYGAILKTRNILTTFDEFKGDTLLTQRDLQDYQSIYLSLFDEFRGKNKTDKENINDDIVFEMELIRQIEVNVDYILELFQKYKDSNLKDKEILVKIEKAVDSSVELRNKKDLILSFIDSINLNSNIYEDFEAFMNSKRKEELDKIIAEENLNKKATYDFMERAFGDGFVEVAGIEITKILPAISRFSVNSDRTQKKDTVINKIVDFFERFFNISSLRF